MGNKYRDNPKWVIDKSKRDIIKVLLKHMRYHYHASHNDIKNYCKNWDIRHHGVNIKDYLDSCARSGEVINGRRVIGIGTGRWRLEEVQ